MNQELLKKLLTYDPETGIFTWNERDLSLIKRPSSLKSWNTRYAGTKITNMDSKGYPFVSISRRHHRLHRLAFVYMGQEAPPVVDHANGIKTDNRFCNLKASSFKLNSLNKFRNSNNTSGVAGVYLNKRKQLWCAQMKFDGHTYHLGSSRDFFEAVCLRKSEENLLGFSHRYGESRPC
jgi:hypothetical protein